ncbi:unnamed protein product [Phaedon cochleariae]|uniref:Peptidase C19 ubiquitin carboxyl-terminal hydrolase domain-containing protein n=1 Tax=Phaedon cochleariae TaxID=80249 RepID=A0A9P0DK31_PHACE|nr:unnamed protein product [Phaedon cochleariae]
MIHSGSASGGHYYAYIKDFEKNWFCFNDQSVNLISYEDIIKTYGGSSTNAYMLIYRQIQKNQYSRVIGDFPPHIQNILKDIRRREEEEKQTSASQHLDALFYAILASSRSYQISSEQVEIPILRPGT